MASRNEETKQSFLTLERSYNDVIEQKKDLFVDYQHLEAKLDELRNENENVKVDREKIRKTWQLKEAKYESNLSHQNKVIADKEKIIVDLKEKLKKAIEDGNNKELEARSYHAKFVSADGENTQLNHVIVKKDRTIDELQNKLSKLHGDMNIYVTSEAKLKSEKENIHTEFTSVTAAMEKYQHDLKISEKENADLRAKVSELQQNLRRSEDRLEKQQRNYENLRQSESQLRQKIHELEQENIRFRNDNIQLKKDLELALNRPAEKSYEVISVDTMQNVEAGPATGDLFSIDSRELEVANHRIKELEDLLHHHEVESSDAQVKLENYKGQITKLECELENALRHKSIGAAELEGEKSKLVRLNNEIRNLTIQIEDSEKSAEQLKKELSKKDKLIDDLRAKIANHDKVIADRDEEIFTLNGNCEYLTLEKQKLQEENQELLKRLADLEADIKMSQDDHDNINTEARGLYRKISDLEAKLTESEKERRLLDDQNNSLQLKIDKLEDELQKTIQEKSIYESQMVDLSSASNKHRDNAVLSKKEAMEHRGELDGLKRELISKDETINRLRDKVDDLNEELDETKKDLEESNSRYIAIEGDIKRLEHDLEVRNADCDRLNELLARTTKERNDAEIQLASLLEKFKTMNTGSGKITAARPSLDINITKVQDLELQLSQWRQKAHALENLSENQHKPKIASLENEIRDKEERIGFLQRSLDSRGTYDDEAEKLLADYKKKCMVLEKELDELLETKERMEEELSDLRPQVGKLEAKSQSLALKKDTLSTQLQEANDKLRLAKENLHTAEMKLMEEGKANKSLGKLVKKHELTIEELTARLKDCEAQLEIEIRRTKESNLANDGLRAKNQEQQKQIAELKDRLTALQMELGELRDHREIIEEDLNSMSYKYSNLNTKVAYIENDKNRYQNDSEASQGKLRKLKEELIQATNQVSKKGQTIDELTLKLKSLETNNARLAREKKILEDEMNPIRKQLEVERLTNEANRETINDLRAQLEAASMNISAPVNVAITESAPAFFQETLQSEPDGRLEELELMYQSSKERESSLRNDVEQKNNKIRQLEVEKRKLSDRSSELEHELTMIQRKYHDLEQSLHRAQRERDDFKKDAIEASNKWSYFEQKAENEESERRSLQRQYDDAMQKLRECQEEILKAEENIVEHRLAVQGLTTDKQYKEEHLHKLRDSTKFLEDQLYSLNQSLSFQREENEKLKDARDQLLENNLTKENAFNRLKADYQSVIAERDRLKEDIKESLDRLEDLDKKREEANRRFETAEEEIESLNIEIHNLKDEINQGQRKYTQLEDKLQSVMDEGEKDQQYIDQLRDSKKGLEDTIAELRSQLANQKSEVRVIQPAAVQEVQAVVESSPMFDFGDSDEVKRLQDENTDLKKRIREGEGVIEKNNKLNERNTESEGRISKLESQLHHSQIRNEDVEKELYALKKEAKPMMEKYETTMRDYESMKDELENLQSKLGNTEIQLDQERSKIKELRRQHGEKDEELHEREAELLSVKKNLSEVQILLKSSNVSDEMERLVEKLKDDEEKSRREIEKLRRDIIGLQQKMTDTYTKKENAEKNLFQSKEYCANLEIDNEKLKQRAQNFETSLKEADDRIHQLEEEIKNQRKEKSFLKSDLNDANNRIKKDKAEIAILKKNNAELQSIIDGMGTDTSVAVYSQNETSSQYEVDKLREKVDKYRKDLQRSQEEVSRLELLLRDKDVKMTGVDNSDSLRKENERLKNALRSQKAETDEYRTNYTNSQKDIERNQLKIVSLNQGKSHLEAKIEALEEEKTRFRKQQTDSAKEISGLKIQIDALKHEKNRLKNELTILNKKYDNVSSQLASLQAQKGGKSKEIVNLKKITDLESKYQSALREKENARNEILSHRKNHARAESALSEQIKTKEALEHEIVCRDNRITELENNLRQVQESHKADKEDMIEWRKKMQGHQQQIQDLEHKNERLLKERRSLQTTIEGLEEDLEEAEKRIDTLEASMEITDDDSVDGFSDHVKLQVKISELEAQLQRVSEASKKAAKEAQDYKSQLWDLQDDIARHKNEVELHRNMKDETNKLNDKLKDELAQLKKDTWEAQQNYNNVIMESSEHKYNKELLETEKGDLDKQIRRLRDEVADTLSQKEVIANERNDLKFQLQRLNVELTQANMEAGEAREQVNSLETERLMLSDENEHLKNKLNSMEIAPVQIATVETVESELPFDFDEYDGAKRDRDQLKLEKESAENRIQHLENDLVEHQKDRGRVEDSLVDARKMISQLETDNKNLITARDNAIYEKEIANQKFIEQRTDNETLKQEKETLLLELKNLRPRLSELENDNEQLQRKVSSYEKQLARIDKRPVEKKKTKRDDSDLQREHVDLQKKFSELQISFKDAEDRAYESERDKDEMERKNALLREDMIFHQSKCEKLEQDCKTFELRIQELEDERRDLLEKLGVSSDSGRGALSESEKIAKINALEKRIETLQQHVSARDDEIDSLKRQLKDLVGKGTGSGELEIHLAEIKDKSEIYRKADKAKAEVIETLRAEKTSLEIELESLRKEVEDGKISVAEFSKENDVLQDEIAKLSAERIAMENKIFEEANNYKIKLSDLQNEKEILVHRYESLEKLVVKYESQIQELREQQANVSNEASTTIIMEVDRKPMTRPHSMPMYVNYAKSDMSPINVPSKSSDNTIVLETTTNSLESAPVDDIFSSTKGDESNKSSSYDSRDYSQRSNRDTSRMDRADRNRDRDRDREKERDRDSGRGSSSTSSSYSSRSYGDRGDQGTRTTSTTSRTTSNDTTRAKDRESSRSTRDIYGSRSGDKEDPGRRTSTSSTTSSTSSSSYSRRTDPERGSSRQSSSRDREKDCKTQ